MTALHEPASRGVVAVIAQQQRWLVIRRSQRVRAPGKFCFPGGGIEGQEREEEALIREIDEELGVDVAPRTRLWASRTSWGVELAWWHAELLHAPEDIVPNPDEVAECRWLTPDEISRLPDLLPSNHDFLSAWRQGKFVLK